jgi:hypothetical protein
MENRKNLWFIPHFPVFTPKKPGKLRLVFDAAVKCEEKNLNDTFLLTGSDLVSSLFGVLCRITRHEIAFSGDIAEMFHQVKIAEDDCWSQCFLKKQMYKINKGGSLVWSLKKRFWFRNIFVTLFYIFINE